MSTQLAIELILHRKLVEDYSWELYLVGYSAEMEFEVTVVAVELPCPPAPPNTPVPSSPPSPPPTPLASPPPSPPRT